MSETIYLNGGFFPGEKAAISPDDRGFIFADGVYEVIKYYKGEPFRYADHLERLERSLKEIGVDYQGIAGLDVVFSRLLTENNLSGTDAGVYVQITRGPQRRIHHFPK